MSSIVLDVAGETLPADLATAFAPHACHTVHPSGHPDAVAALADLAADVVVVGGDPGRWDDGADADRRHRELALVPWWWARAADVVGAHVVVVSHALVFAGGPGPLDEFATPAPATATGRALLAAERLAVATAPTSIVRHEGSSDAALVELVRWLGAARLVGTWHLAAEGGVLDDRHTRLVRGVGSTRRGPGTR